MTETTEGPETERVTSKDGTTIVFERHGTGPVLIVVDGALCARHFGPGRPFAETVSKSGGGFTVVCYDRRGRGESGNTLPYAVEREVEDLSAVIDAVGGDAFLLGFSSGAALAYETTASGASVRRVFGYEAPYIAEEDAKHRAADHLARLNALLADGSDKGRGKAVDYFMTSMVGGPFFLPVLMRTAMAKYFPSMKAIAPTLPYDTKVMNSNFTVPRGRFAKIDVPVLVGVGGKAKPNMVAAENAVQASIPGSELRVLPGQTHQVSDAAILPLVREFFV
jgi:pimeloyl-ACP methyl ester carboxylesterase